MVRSSSFWILAKRPAVIIGAALVGCSFPGSFEPDPSVTANNPPTFGDPTAQVPSACHAGRDLGLLRLSPPEGTEVFLGNSVTIQATATDDDPEDCENLSYTWRQTGGSAVLDTSGLDTDTLTFNLPVQDPTQPPVDRGFVFLVEVTDGFDSDFATYSLATSSRQPPVADAGDDLSFNHGSFVKLDGSGSFDPDGDPFTLQWEQVNPNGTDPTITLSADDIVDPSFTAPSADATLTFRLTATDDTGSTSDQVTILVASLPEARIAQACASGACTDAAAGESLTAVTVGPSSVVTLTGQGTVPGAGTPAEQEWTQAAGPGVILATPDSSTTSFTAPSQVGVLRIAYRVSDGTTWSAPATILVSVNPLPNASVPPNLDMVNGETLTIIGSGADPAGEPIAAYLWDVLLAPVGSTCATRPTDCIAGIDTDVINFTPDRKGTWQLGLVVTDASGGDSAVAKSLVTVHNRPAEVTAITATPQNPVIYGAVSLGATTTDLDGDSVIGWAWSVVDSPGGAPYHFVDPAGLAPDPALIAAPRFVPEVRARFILGLRVDDGEGLGPARTVLVEVRNTLPVADGGGPEVTAGGEGVYVTQNFASVDLDATGSGDLDGDTLSYQWTYLGLDGDTSAGTLSNRFSLSAQLTPTARSTVAGDDPSSCTPESCHTLSLVVTELREGGAASAPVTVYVVATNSNPVSDAGADVQNQAVGGQATLNASASFDPDGDVLASYRWTCLSAPAATSCAAAAAAITGGSPVSVAGPCTRSGSGTVDVGSATATFVPPAFGTYTFQLEVLDGQLCSTNVDTVDVVVNNTAPIAQMRICPTNSLCVPADERKGLPLGGLTTYLFADDGIGGLSIDPDGDPVTFVWTVTYGDPAEPVVTVTGGTGDTAHFDSPATEFADPAYNFVTITLTLRDNRGGSASVTSNLIPFLPSFSQNIFVARPGVGDGFDGDDGNADCGDFLTALNVPCASIGRGAQRAVAMGRNVIVTEGVYDEELVLDETFYGLSLRGGFSRGDLVVDRVNSKTVLTPSSSAVTCPAAGPPYAGPFFQSIVVTAPPAGWDQVSPAAPLIEGIELRSTIGAHCVIHNGSPTCTEGVDTSGCGIVRTSGTPLRAEYQNFWGSHTEYYLNASVGCYGCALTLRDSVLRPGGAAAGAGVFSMGVIVQGSGSNPVLIEGNDIQVPKGVSYTSGVWIWDAHNVVVRDNVIDTAVWEAGLDRGTLIWAGDGNTPIPGTRVVIDRNRLRMRSDSSVVTGSTSGWCAAIETSDFPQFSTYLTNNVISVESDCNGGNYDNIALVLYYDDVAANGGMITGNTFRYSHPIGSRTRFGIHTSSDTLNEAWVIQSNDFQGFDSALRLGNSCFGYSALLDHNNFYAVGEIDDVLGLDLTDLAVVNGGTSGSCDFGHSTGNASRACTYVTTTDIGSPDWFRPAAGSPCIDQGSTATTSHYTLGVDGAVYGSTWDPLLTLEDLNGDERVNGAAVDVGAVER